MTVLLSFVFLLLLIVVVIWKTVSADRAAKKAAREREKRRAEQEAKLMEKVNQLKNRTDLDRTNSAVNRDPERAAQVVGKMMKQ
jgi:hypothetical protein